MVVIGSGFIGCEIAASLRRRGHAVTLRLRRAAAQRRAARPRGGRADPPLARRGRRRASTSAPRSTRSRAGDGVARGASRHRCAQAATVVVMAAGVAPRGELAAGRGTRARRRRRPRRRRDAHRDEPGCTPPATSRSPTTRAPGAALRVEHWGDALGQGEVAGRTAAGEDGAVGRRPRVLVDDRRPHAQVRGLGRRVRRSLGSSSTATARSPPGMAATARSSACSPTKPTRTTSAAAR